MTRMARKTKGRVLSCAIAAGLMGVALQPTFAQPAEETEETGAAEAKKEAQPAEETGDAGAEAKEAQPAEDTAQPNAEAKPNDGSAEAKPNDKTEDASPESIVRVTEEIVKQARAQGQTPRNISDLYLRSAGQCRDSGAPPSCAIPLFESAIKADPKNARAHAVYGDYLSFGYLGRFAQASHHYYKALEILKEFPDPALKKRINRSFSLLYRDRKLGVPLLANSKISVFATPNGDFRELRPWLSFVQVFKPSHGLLLQELATRNSFPGLNPELIQKRAPLTEDQLQLNLGAVVRFGKPWLPFVRYHYQVVDIDPFSINAESLAEPYDGRIGQHAITIGGNYPIGTSFDLYAEVVGSLRKTKVTDSFADPSVRIETEDTRTIDALVNFKRNFGLTVLQATGIATFASHENSGSDDDSSDSQVLSLRWSKWPQPKTSLSSNSRFLGRRSTHVTVGAVRSSRRFKTNGTTAVTETRYLPNATLELQGVLDGSVDLALNYQFGRTHSDRTVGENNHFNTHSFRFDPAWSPVFLNYDQGFKTGLEEVRITLPVGAEIGAGEYDRVWGGLQLQQRYVTRHFGFRVFAGATYGYYPELKEDARSVFLGLELQSGHIKK